MPETVWGWSGSRCAIAGAAVVVSPLVRSLRRAGAAGRARWPAGSPPSGWPEISGYWADQTRVLRVMSLERDSSGDGFGAASWPTTIPRGGYTNHADRAATGPGSPGRSAGRVSWRFGTAARSRGRGRYVLFYVRLAGGSVP